LYWSVTVRDRMPSIWSPRPDKLGDAGLGCGGHAHPPGPMGLARLNLGLRFRAPVPEAAPKVRPWPRPLVAALLAVFVLIDGALWIAGSYYLFLGIPYLPEAGIYLTPALLLFMFVSWGWRWAVAAGYVGGRPTARFGGA
jgi:hypothetical protein